MKNDNLTKTVTGVSLFAGALVGLGTGFLFAPQSGDQTRRQVGNWMKTTEENFKERASGTQKTMGQFMDRTKKFWQERTLKVPFTKLEIKKEDSNHSAKKCTPLVFKA